MHRFLPIVVLVVLIIAIFNFLPFKRWLVYSLHISGDSTTSCCQVKNISQTGNFDELSDTAIFNSQAVDYPKTSLAYSNNPPVVSSENPKSEEQVLGTTNASGEEKWIEISLDEQRLRAWEGNRVVMEFPISSGLWYPTPKGTFNIWYKTRYTRMTGGNKDWGTFYDLPNVPDDLFFYQGYGIHGAYWHNNFGHPMSHGCVNEPLANAHELFEWAGPVLPPGVNSLRASADNPGTRVFIH